MTIDKEIWTSATDLLNKFSNENGHVDYDQFRAICGELFGPEELQAHEDRIRDIFEILDADTDGVLNAEEWERCHKEWISVLINPVNVLLVVDMQNDFIDGTLAMRSFGKGQDGADVIEPINQLLREINWNKVFYSMDWHPENHISFYENLQLREFSPDSKIKKEDAKLYDTVLFMNSEVEQTLWPRHCVMDTHGAQLHKDLVITTNSEQIRKGVDPDVDCYSMFMDNSQMKSTGLLDKLRELRATDIYVCGIAYEVCVKATCLDGLRLGFPLAVIEDCCRGVDPVDIEKARCSIVENGGLITDSKEVAVLVNGDKRSIVMAQQLASMLTEKSEGTGIEETG